MIKAIFFDIDGTLVSFQTHQIPDSTRRTLQKLKEKGVLLFVATGRSKGGLEVLSGIPFDGYITLNGQYIYTRENEIIYENTIPSEDIEILLQELKTKPFPCGFTTKDGKFYNFRDQRVEELHRMTHNDGESAGDLRQIEHGVYQVQAFLNQEEEKELLQKMKHCTSARWYPTFTDISPIGGTKVLGMDRFAERFGFTMAETMAFGDGGNDASMVGHAGIGIAMGNGTEELKHCADYITDDVDHDGIPNAVQYYSEEF